MTQAGAFNAKSGHHADDTTLAALTLSRQGTLDDKYNEPYQTAYQKLSETVFGLGQELHKKKKPDIDESAKPYSPKNPVMTKIAAIEESLSQIASTIAEISEDDLKEVRRGMKKIEDSVYEINVEPHDLAVYAPREEHQLEI